MNLTEIFHSQSTQMLISGVVCYYAFLYILHRFMSHVYADFYSSLVKQHGTRKTLALLVFIIGVLKTFVSAPACAHAFMSSSLTTGDVSKTPITMDAKICLGTRAVLWTAELPLLGDTHFYIVHHVLSLTSLSIAVSESLSLRPLYLIYAGLITEVFSSSRAFLRGTGLHLNHPKLYARITYANALGIIFARALPAVYILFNELSASVFTDKLGLAYFCCTAFYTVFVTYIAYKLLAGFGHVSFHPAQPAHLLITTGKHTQRISVFSLLLAFAMVAAKLSTAVLYEYASKEPLSRKEMASLVTIGFGTVIAGLFGAKMMNAALSISANKVMGPQKTIDTPSKGASRPQSVSCRFFPGFNGISIQGAILFSVVWLFTSPLLGLRVNNRVLFGAVGVSLVLGEAIGRVGCYFAGCCGSTRREKYPNIQLLSATLNIAVFIARAMHLANNGTFNIFEAGVEAVLANGVVRLVLNPLRSDAAEKMLNPASLFATAQVMFASAMLALEKAGTGTDLTTAVLTTIGVASRNMLMCRIATFVWPLAATQMQKWKLARFMRLENFVYAFSAIIIVLVIKSGASDQVARPTSLLLGQERLLLLANPALWCSVAVTAALPVVLLN